MEQFRSITTALVLLVLAACSSTDPRSDAYGNFEVEDVIVSSEANGKIIFLKIQEGQRIEQGVAVAAIDTTQLVLQRRQLFAQIETVSSRINNIESQIQVQEQQKKNLLRDQQRTENLVKDGAATQKQLDDINGAIDLVDSQILSIQTQYTSVKSELEVIRTQIEQVEESIDRCIIQNPIGGIVLEKYAEENEVTAFGKPIYKIADLDDMILRVYISGAQLPSIKLGQEVEVLFDQDENSLQRLPGTIFWISEKAEFTPKIIQTKEERVNMVYAVKVRVTNDGRLKIGMPGEVNFNGMQTTNK